MKRTSLFSGIVMIIALCATAVAVASVTVAREAEPIAAQKTYKRRCSNYKCKIVSESTKPIFKCPHCGSSTVPVT
jgi:Zn finger protein HypA/HybF involved in hydrogenase expression